ncbi:hypothetical protein P170DRAFT_286111 [Aspergillus steynii IBT 23096]|uniref:Uncharacterized protein n=1 Tax=Aspergillus steynii IBT 23096 TaxID=1392250 RepID=A0A2I2FUU6_9EURO|nr:uncharacterized protein P170DRAFT_286111 [Aspergillus steynii IBT 23096]PLB44394.1 hypothetical protein P170DRAFT_286111 [Aspergillus steynii IBT 23096]
MNRHDKSFVFMYKTYIIKCRLPILAPRRYSDPDHQTEKPAQHSPRAQLTETKGKKAKMLAHFFIPNKPPRECRSPKSSSDIPSRCALPQAPGIYAHI